MAKSMKPTQPQDATGIAVRQKRSEIALSLLNEYHDEIKQRIENGELKGKTLDQLTESFRKLVNAMKEPASQYLGVYVAPAAAPAPKSDARDRAVRAAGDAGGTILDAQEQFLDREGE